MAPPYPMNYWICYEVNHSDTAGTTDFGVDWAQSFESFETLNEAIVERNKLLFDSELYRNVSPILHSIIP